MIIGMSVANFTTFHVVLSLIGIASGFIVIFAMLANKTLPALTALFLLTTVATSVTGFFFPSTGIDPAQVVGIVSLLVLVAALIARYTYRLNGRSRWVYIVAAVMAQWFNCFVGAVQSFQKIAFVHALAPTQKEPPFLIVQLALAVFLIALGALALRRFRPTPAAAR